MDSFKTPASRPKRDEDDRFFHDGLTDEQRMILNHVDSVSEDLTHLKLQKMIRVVSKLHLKNNEQRERHKDSPEKFFDSEMALVEEIRLLGLLATAPLLYSAAIALKLSDLLINLLAHPNTDVGACVVSVLVELFNDEVTSLGDSVQIKTEIANLANELADLGLLQHLAAMCAAHDIESEDLQVLLTLIEDLSNVENFSERQCSESNICACLLAKLECLDFVPNRAHAVEVLGSLCQQSKTGRAQVQSLQGIEVLLRLIAKYRKRDPASSHEAEYPLNACDVLVCALEAGNEALTDFFNLEGIDLMLLCIEAQKLMRISAMRVLQAAVSSTLAQGCRNARALVSNGGLAHIGAVFLQRDRDRMLKAYKDEFDPISDQRYAVSLLWNIGYALFIDTTANSPAQSRFLCKFIENSHEKLVHAVELFVDRNNEDDVLEYAMYVDLARLLALLHVNSEECSLCLQALLGSVDLGLEDIREELKHHQMCLTDQTEPYLAGLIDRLTDSSGA